MKETRAFIYSLTELMELLNSRLPGDIQVLLTIDKEYEHPQKILTFRFIVHNPDLQEKLYELAKGITPDLQGIDLELDTGCFGQVWQTADYEVKRYMYDYLRSILGFGWDYWINEDDKIIIVRIP